MQDPVVVSVVMPIRNEARSIRATLAAVLGQDYPRELMEVIVADGGSDDGTLDVLRQMTAQHPNLKVIENPAGIVPTGLNLAIHESKGDVIVRIDGHTIVAADYVSECVAALRRTGAGNVGGRMRAEGEGLFGQAVAVATCSPFGIGGARFHYSEVEEWVDTVYMGAWRRTVLEGLGPFDEELVRDQDDELNYRLLDNGGRILLSPRIQSSYAVRGTPRSLWRQYFQYGYWKVRVIQKHPRQVRFRQLVPPAFAGGMILSLFLACVRPEAVLFWAPVPTSYALASLGASIASARRSTWGVLALLPLVYTILHLSYGLGFLAGLVRFSTRWRSRAARRPSQAAGGDASA